MMLRSIVAVLLVSLVPSGLFAEGVTPPVGTAIRAFTLPDGATGEAWSLAEQGRGGRAVVLVFTCTGCPVCTNYVPRLASLSKKYAKKGVVWAAVNSQDADDPQIIAGYLSKQEYPFPMLRDVGAAVAAQLLVERVPTVVVLDERYVVRYHGRIDDQFTPTARLPKATTSELEDALKAVVAGDEVATSSTPAAGCLLTYDRPVDTGGRPAEAGAATVTYHEHVARIVQAKCQECHRPGEAGPFTLTSYADAKRWSAMIREVVAADVMPPWHAAEPRGHFRNDRRLAPEDKATLLAWIDQGCAEGDPAKSPPPRAFAAGWRLGREPDEVLQLPKPIEVPASGNFPYQYVMINDGFPVDRWVTAVEVRPEQRAVVHHIIAFLLPPGKGLRELDGPHFGEYMLGAYVPGDQPLVGGPGQAKRIVQGSRIVLEIHYTPNGHAVADRSSIGLCYTDEAPEVELESLAVMNNRFEIPPGVDDHEVVSKYEFKDDSTLLSLTPHMHVRGKSFRYELLHPDGTRRTVLDVPRYDFNWQSSYDFAEPVEIPAGTRMVCTARYDNSAKNLSNPNPNKSVRWGNMTTDEMMIGFVMYHRTKRP